MARLSVNLNKIALLRNSRHTGVPDLMEFGRHRARFRGRASPCIPGPTSGTSGAPTCRRSPI